MHVIEISTNDIGTDEIVIKIHASNASEAFLNEVKDFFRAKLRVSPHIVWVDKESLEKFVMNPLSRKPINFIDKR